MTLAKALGLRRLGKSAEPTGPSKSKMAFVGDIEGAVPSLEMLSKIRRERPQDLEIYTTVLLSVKSLNEKFIKPLEAAAAEVDRLSSHPPPPSAMHLS